MSTTIDLDLRALERIETVEEFLAQLDATTAAAVSDALALASQPTSAQDLENAELAMFASVNVRMAKPREDWCFSTMKQSTKYCS